ncbi:MAG: hypothetical protein JST08_05330 [Actinobacteria bacterium]|nr:hypothetical protein [Actinomycetota bacterium]
MRTARSSLDLLAAIALALAGLAAALIGLPDWLRVVLLAPLALGVCGYAILAALLPDAELPPAERLVYAVVVSLVATALGGVVVGLFVALDRTVWAILLVALTIAAASVALWRRGGRAPGAGEGGHRLALPGPLSTLAVVAAVAVACVAVAISSAGAKRERDGYAFTALWAQPVDAVVGSGQAVAIGVDNHQGASARYRLVVRQGGATLAARGLVLANGGRFRLRVRSGAIAPADPVTVDLLRGGAVFRRVYLENATR